MKKHLLLGVIVTVGAVLSVASCQSSASNKTAANADTGMAAHDMSNMNHDLGNMNMDHDMADGHDAMNMSSDPGAAQAPYDLQFLDSMIHHHNGAIMMAKMVLGKTERAELKTFAQKIIDDQTKEIDRIKQMREQWYSGKPSAVNMEMPGMVGGMKIMTSEHMKDMAEMPPDHFDDHFLNMMTAHHEGAITMAKEAASKAEHPEVKTLAKQIISEQQPEIDQMKKWKKAWE